MATWVETPYGAVNLDLIAVAEAQSNGDVYLYGSLSGGSYRSVSLGSTQAQAQEKIRQLTRAVPASDV